MNQPKVAEAFEVVKQALKDDPEYAWSWHCNIAMAIYDESRPQCVCVYRDETFTGHFPDCSIVRANDAKMYTPLTFEFCNNTAARFMKLCFDVDTSKPPQAKREAA